MDASGSIVVELDAILEEKLPSKAVDRFCQFLKLLDGKSSQFVLEAISKIANSISQDSVTVISARQICGELISFIDTISNDILAAEAFQLLLVRMQSRIVAFEAQLADLRDVLAKRLTSAGKLKEAVSVLASIPLESGQRSYTVQYKLDIYLRIVENYLSLGDQTQAEVYINRASLFQADCQDQTLLMRYKAAYTRLLDFKQKFLEAGQRYAELSIRFPWLDEPTRMAFLERSLLSALLAGAGQQRARLLATLYKDERCQSLQAYPILQKMYMRRLISRDCLQSLEPLLLKYYPQMFTGGTCIDPRPSLADGDGSSFTDDVGSEKEMHPQPLSVFQNILERVVVEHNMLAASLIYNNISLKNLGELLQITDSQAESIAAQMISEDRLVAQIDQIDGIIRFESQDSTAASLSSRVQSLCTEVNRIVEGIEADHPAWVAVHSV